MVGAAAPLAYRIAFTALAVGIVGWTYRGVRSVAGAQAQVKKRLGIDVSRRVIVALLFASIPVGFGMAVFLGLYLAGRVG